MPKIKNKKFKHYKNYVCPRCFQQLPNCKCCEYLPYSLICIDENIQEHVQILNKKGYITATCCEGHYDNEYGTTIHISFAFDYGIENMNLPNGFKYLKKRRLIEYFISPKYKQNEMEMIKQERLKELLEWINDLPIL